MGHKNDMVFYTTGLGNYKLYANCRRLRYLYEIRDSCVLGEKGKGEVTGRLLPNGKLMKYSNRITASPRVWYLRTIPANENALVFSSTRHILAARYRLHSSISTPKQLELNVYLQCTQFEQVSEFLAKRR